MMTCAIIDIQPSLTGLLGESGKSEGGGFVMPTGLYERPPIEERFWAQLVKKGPNCCWNWTGAKTKGHGRLKLKGETIVAHRFAYELLVGPIPEGLQIDHLCRNRACVNPAHLEPVTCRQNILRGEGFAAKEARLTHCLHGHLFDLFNTYYRPDGHRACRVCHAARNRKWRKKA